jgi:phosphoserine aminotransferase
MLNYQTHIDKGSMFNTPPVFPVFVSLLTLRWLKAQGGVEAIQKINEAKAKLVYDEIDVNPCFRGRVETADRSLMNVTFFAQTPELETAFFEVAKAANISGVGGYRTIGGFRASIYNAMSMASVEHLVKTMRDFAKENA